MRLPNFTIQQPRRFKLPSQELDPENLSDKGRKLGLLLAGYYLHCTNVCIGHPKPLLGLAFGSRVTMTSRRLFCYSFGVYTGRNGSSLTCSSVESRLFALEIKSLSSCK